MSGTVESKISFYDKAKIETKARAKKEKIRLLWRRTRGKLKLRLLVKAV